MVQYSKAIEEITNRAIARIGGRPFDGPTRFVSEIGRMKNAVQAVEAIATNRDPTITDAAKQVCPGCSKTGPPRHHIRDTRLHPTDPGRFHNRRHRSQRKTLELLASSDDLGTRRQATWGMSSK